MTDEIKLSKWLVDNGYAEKTSGTGHVSGDDLAAALLSRYDMEAKPVVDGNIYDVSGKIIREGDRFRLVERVFGVADKGEMGTVVFLDPYGDYLNVNAEMDTASKYSTSGDELVSETIALTTWVSGETIEVI